MRVADRLRTWACRAQSARVAELEARLDHERLFPAEWANRRVRDRFGDEVQAGPFAGMRYPDYAIERVDLFAPKLLGSFEQELHEAIESAVEARPRLVVNVGAADGYYVVGLARRLPAARVVAFEADESKHWLPHEIADLNGVRHRIDVRGACEPRSLNDCLEDGALVVCDCDGCELELLDVDRVPALSSATVIVEAHDLLVPGIKPALLGRFAPTHDIEEVPTLPRYVDDFPQLGDIPLVTRQLAISEFRGAPMSWLVMRPR